MKTSIKKRIFDLVFCFASAPVWLTSLIVCAIVQLLFEGRPVFYASLRRIHGTRQARVLKFRAMVRDADKIYNRVAVPVSKQRFLNTPIDSPLYTPIGRIFERCQFTELPQMLQVITGTLSIVGNRPLPEDVISSLKEIYPNTEERFDSPAGLTGLAQIIGRDILSDAARLEIEARYCHIVNCHYSLSMDFQIVLFTVLIILRCKKALTVEYAHRFLDKFGQRKVLSPVARRNRLNAATEGIQSE